MSDVKVLFFVISPVSCIPLTFQSKCSFVRLLCYMHRKFTYLNVGVQLSSRAKRTRHLGKALPSGRFSVVYQPFSSLSLKPHQTMTLGVLRLVDALCSFAQESGPQPPSSTQWMRCSRIVIIGVSGCQKSRSTGLLAGLLLNSMGKSGDAFRNAVSLVRCNSRVSSMAYVA